MSYFIFSPLNHVTLLRNHRITNGLDRPSRLLARLVALVAGLVLLVAPLSAATVTGTALRPGGLAAQNVNVDFIDRVSGINIPIASGDTTNVTGSFTVTVPDGSYDITYTPPLASGLAGYEQTNITILGDTAVPPVTLPLGYIITLQTIDFPGNPLDDIVASFENPSAQKVFTPNNTSDAAGNITTLVPQTAGPYTIKVRDVAGRGFAVKELVNFSPTADTDLGPIIVGPAQTFTGRTIRYGTGLPVADVNVDVIDACGLELKLQGDLTDAAGNFVATGLSDGIYQVVFRPTLASGLMRKTLTGVGVDEPLALGNIELGVARVVSGRVVNTGATPLANIDLDFRDQNAGYEIDTPGDDTLVDGTFSVTVPEGLYTIDFRPLFDPAYAPRTLFGIVVTSNVNLGDVVLQGAVLLSGVVTDFNGQPIENADLDVLDPATGLRLFTQDDRTGPTGAYNSRLAPGTWNLRFSPPASRPDLWYVEFPAYTISGNQVLDVVLPQFAAANAWQLYR